MCGLSVSGRCSLLVTICSEPQSQLWHHVNAKCSSLTISTHPHTCVWSILYWDLRFCWFCNRLICLKTRVYGSHMNLSALISQSCIRISVLKFKNEKWRISIWTIQYNFHNSNQKIIISTYFLMGIYKEHINWILYVLFLVCVPNIEFLLPGLIDIFLSFSVVGGIYTRSFSFVWNFMVLTLYTRVMPKGIMAAKY